MGKDSESRLSPHRHGGSTQPTLPSTQEGQSSHVLVIKYPRAWDRVYSEKC